MNNIFNINNILSLTFLFLPFVFLVLMIVLPFLKNPIIIRRIAKFVLGVEFIFSSLNLILFDKFDFMISNFKFLASKTDLFFLFLTSFVFLMFSIFSKAFVKFAHKMFYSTLIMIFGLLNFFIISDNIFVSFLLLLWLILAQYLLLNITFKEDEYKKLLKRKFIPDLFIYFISLFLIGFDFLRYFVLNEVPFEFSTIADNFSHIDDFSILLAFVGFLLLIFRQFNFLSIFGFYSKTYSKIPFYFLSVLFFLSTIVGICLLIKTYFAFDYLFYQYQIYIVLFLLLNLIYHSFLVFRQDCLLRAFVSIYIINIVFLVFSVFSFDNDGICPFIYYTIAFLISFVLLLLIFALFEEKFQTKKLEDFKKINDKTKITQIFTLYSILNFAKMPLGAGFFAFLILFLTINSIDYSDIISNIMPYLILFSMFLADLSLFNILYKILIEPAETMKNKFVVLKHQHNVFLLFILVSILLIFALKFLFGEFNFDFSIRNF